ncbi:uncharacterized protein K441DRAFT_663146 [Cenococcum geophilum 1.58]|uniref:uncharacterized protein n=1 Tax=Cenococcum geophilum 1.58 TaxID=794803 RepID=UPI00358E455A|nr:hypothetical protein K441DRAFT_663146 [Cenococcum geophilum 1.58]
MLLLHIQVSKPAAGRHPTGYIPCVLITYFKFTATRIYVLTSISAPRAFRVYAITSISVTPKPFKSTP